MASFICILFLILKACLFSVEKRQMRGNKKLQKDAKPTKSTSTHHASLLDFINENEAVSNEQSDTADEEYEPITGSAYQRHQYGYMPRFQRLQILHVYLWQLVYGTSEDAALCAGTQQIHGNSTDLRKEHYGWLTHLQQLPVHRLGKGEYQNVIPLATSFIQSDNGIVNHIIDCSIG